MVGGGPTGVEFSGELSDFIMKDVRKRYAHVKDDIHVTLIEVCFKKLLIEIPLLCMFYHFTIVSVLSIFYRPTIYFRRSMIDSDIMLSSS